MTYLDAGLVHGTTYRFRVVAINGCGSSTNSNVVEVATLPRLVLAVPPSGPSVRTVGIPLQYTVVVRDGVGPVVEGALMGLVGYIQGPTQPSLLSNASGTAVLSLNPIIPGISALQFGVTKVGFLAGEAAGAALVVVVGP